MRTTTKYLSVLLFAVLALFLLPACQNRPLAADGVYEGDRFLYESHKTIDTSYQSIRSLLLWELQHEDTLPASVISAADTIRDEAPQAHQAALAAVDLYAGMPTPENKDAVQAKISALKALLETLQRFVAEHAATPTPQT